jgi:hypothetical protein
VCFWQHKKYFDSNRFAGSNLLFWRSAGEAGWGATMDDRSQGFDFFSVAELGPEIDQAKYRSTDEPVEELSRSLLARITRTVVHHETDDWPGDYDRLYALICKVVAQSNLNADTKALLTRRLIGRVADLEKKWPKSKQSRGPCGDRQSSLRAGLLK